MFELMIGGWVLCVLFLVFGCALLSSAVADSKGRSGFLWFFVGFFFNIFALIAIAGMPSLLDVPNRKTHMRCPDCREFVYKDAKVCKYCGCKLIGIAEEEEPSLLERLIG